jgi:hypothetical protein
MVIVLRSPVLNRAVTKFTRLNNKGWRAARRRAAAHPRPPMATHYSAAELGNLVAAVNRVSNSASRSVHMAGITPHPDNRWMTLRASRGIQQRFQVLNQREIMLRIFTLGEDSELHEEIEIAGPRIEIRAYCGSE